MCKVGNIGITAQSKGAIATTDKTVVVPVARGKVFFNVKGEEVGCIKSNDCFETWVESENNQGEKYAGKYYEKAEMPRIISNIEVIATHKVYYQKYDHEIAVYTHLFNRKLEADKIILKEKKIFILKNSDVQKLFKLPIFETGGRFFVGGGSYSKLPTKLDPTLVKAICMRETRCNISGQKNDIMQVNVGDWASSKAKIGLTNGASLTVVQSIKAGILWLYGKGITNADKYYMKNLKWTSNGWDYSMATIENITNEKGKNAEFNIVTWKYGEVDSEILSIDKDWRLTTQDYNGSSQKKAYLEAVNEYYKGAAVPCASDYYADSKNYIKPTSK